MAQFKIKDNETGLTITVEGDQPPTQEDSLQIIQDARTQIEQQGQVGASSELAPTDQTRLDDPGFFRYS